MLREAQAQKVSQAFDDGKLESGKGLNQELSLGRSGDTRWGSHYKLIVNVISLYPMICKVLDKIGDVSSSSDDRLKADVVGYSLESFDFIFMIHLMKTIFGVANDLNNALQRKDQDIVNAMVLVTLTKQQLQQVRDNGWEPLLSSFISFYEKNCIKAPNMEDVYVPTGRKKRGKLHTTNLHHFRVEVFVAIIDLQLQELKNRFDEVSMDLLVNMATLSPVDDFKSFDKEKVIALAKLYPSEFSSVELVRLGDQLENYIYDMKKDDRFQGLKDLKELSKEMVRSNKDKVFDHVYLLIKLVLILPVATTSVERAFSAMTFVKNKLRKSIGDQLLNDCLVTYIEKDVFSKVSDEVIVTHDQNISNRRQHL
ncbi:uncharacterized protein LOC111883960 [Lactuca sativa]|uniref:uncharacterized protein LOC111883960 n=1 Tax=Lactuca sativa TaxID=4236 RepID=UPI000CD89403|nr:uncharacterized protein LOC111883960 [Lactuca sativa]